ncbi:MAG: tetratricopeptide repeat protein [Gammaproteobacteria bacterium]|nr:tetratricopeptide repeat protein [Gammaproteobacteria bacterium]
MAIEIPDSINNTDSLFQEAAILFQRGNLSEAEIHIHKLLSIAPNHAGGTHLLGIIQLQHGRHEPAVELLSRAISLDPLQSSCHNNLANALHMTGQLEVALAASEKAIRLKPDFAAAYNTYAVILRDMGQHEKALMACDQAIRFKADFSEAYNNRGAILLDLRRPQEAIDSCRRAIELNPNYASAYNILGVAYKSIGRLAEALSVFRMAVEINPNLANAYDNLGSLLHEMGCPMQALAACERAMQINPSLSQTHGNRANILGDIGRYEEAESSYRRALALDPGNAVVHSNLLFLLAAQACLPAGDMLNEQRHWDRTHGAEGRAHQFPTWAPQKQLGRRIRVGYVSPDFRAHPVGYFIEPLLAAHDKSRFEIFCYANHAIPESDSTTERLRALADHWRFVYEKSDNELASDIYKDSIDILVDLAGHTKDNRLKAFTYRPAPIQATYLGYLASTGLDSMNYWITDEVLHPVDTEEITSEQIYRLPRCAFCYAPPAESIPMKPRNKSRSQIVFGSFNHLSKLTPQVIETWSQILKELPGSQLLIMDKFMIEPECRQWLLQRFSSHGVSAERLSLRERVPLPQYFSTYAGVDIALDPFPRTGGTTTADALWMGVPVITLAGQGYAGRISASKLMAIGLGNLIAQNQQQYIEIAVSLALDIDQRIQLRKDLRDRMANSPLRDANSLAQAVEAAYLSMRSQMELPNL